MRSKASIGIVARTLLAIGVLGLTVTAFSAGGLGGLQRGGQDRGRSGSNNSPRQPQPVQHARRDVVRTNNYVPRQNPTEPVRQPQQNRPDVRPDQGQPNQPGSRPGQVSRQGTVGGRRPVMRNTPQVQNQRKFTKTTQGRVYDNGLQLRKGIKVSLGWERPYFPHGYVHFPYYRQTYARGSVYISPFGFFFGVCVPFIDPGRCHIFPPSVVFIDAPLYSGNDCIGYGDSQEENWFNRSDLDTVEPGLGNAIDELSETFQNGNIDALVALIDPNTSIAIYLRGKYRYSIASNDYVDMTRDAIQSTHTVSFELTTLHQRSPSVFSASGIQTYTAQDGSTRRVYVSYVLQDISGQWTLTQVGTAPDHVQKW